MPRQRKGVIEKHGRSWRMTVKVDRKRVRRVFPTRGEAEEALAELLNQVERDASADLAAKLGRLTVADVVNLYYDRRKNDLELSTRARYEGVLRKHVIPGIGALPAKDIAATPLLLEDWLATIPWGQARKALEVLSPAFRTAYDNGLIPCDPVAKIRRPKRPDRKRKKEIPTPSEVEKIVISAYEEDVWWGYFVELTATLGLRRSETAALRWEDFEFPRDGSRYGVVHIRRAVGKRDGGTYIKPPKSGQARDLLVHRSLFEGLDYFDGATGWLFPGRDVDLRKPGEQIAPRSTARRLLVHLFEEGGAVACPDGRAGADVRRAIGTNSATLSQVVKDLLARGLIERDAHARRTFRLALTDAGATVARELASTETSPVPMHPDTAGHRFVAMTNRLGLVGTDGKPYGLHSLRHYRATHLYNKSKTGFRSRSTSGTRRRRSRWSCTRTTSFSPRKRSSRTRP